MQVEHVKDAFRDKLIGVAKRKKILFLQEYQIQEKFRRI